MNTIEPDNDDEREDEKRFVDWEPVLVEEQVGTPPVAGDLLFCEGCESEFEFDGKCDLYCLDCRDGMELIWGS